ncbi:predicted protein, partial [Nematostella vectensis]
LRCQFKGGKRQEVLDLTANSTVTELQEKIWLITDVPPHAQRVLTGFPPRELIFEDKGAKLSYVNIRSGDTLIVEQDTTAPRILQVNQSHSTEASSTVPLSRKVVPADNSCLFSSISYLLTGSTALVSDLRQLIARCVSEDPEHYNEVFLGKSNEQYCSWILDKSNWGGAIELSILAKHYKMEIAVVDTESERIDRFEEDKGYEDRVFLIYDGIHYDPLGVHDASATPLQTIFSCQEYTRLTEALQLAADAKKNRQYTNLSKFTLRCLVCNTPLTGQIAAQQHAVSTGHTNFGEV